MTLIISYWTDPMFKNHQSEFTANQWWGVKNIPGGAYRIVTRSSGLSALVLHRQTPQAQIGNLNSQLGEEWQTVSFDLPEDSDGMVIQPMIPEGGTGRVDRIMIIREDYWEPLRELTGMDVPYFDANTMPME